MKFKNRLVVCTAAVNSSVPDTIELIPLGRVKTTKGDFFADQESYELINQHFLRRGVDIVIDYEHQTLVDVQAPAAGWIKSLSLSDKAICAQVEWTPKAREYLQNKEYRYCSPVLLARNKDNKAVQLQSVGLTNTPAIDGMFAIVNSAKFDYEEGEESMEFLKTLAKLLGLPDTATEDEVAAAVKAAAEAAAKQSEGTLVVNKTVSKLLELPETADTAEVTAKIMALKNPANHVSVEAHAAVLAKLQKYECDDVVQMALKDGKITPAQEAWAKEYVLKDPKGFTKFLELATPTVPMGKLDIPSAPGSKSATNETDTLVCKNLGITSEDLKTYGGK